MSNKLFPNGNPYKSDYWQPDSTGSDTTNPPKYRTPKPTLKMAISYAEAEHILRKAADADALWYKRNTFAVFMYGIGIGSFAGSLGVGILYWIMKGC